MFFSMFIAAYIAAQTLPASNAATEPAIGACAAEAPVVEIAAPTCAVPTEEPAAPAAADACDAEKSEAPAPTTDTPDAQTKAAMEFWQRVFTSSYADWMRVYRWFMN